MPSAASDRVFRAYVAHCTAPNADSLFNYLNALRSFNDKLPKDKRLFGSPEFIGLKALRNLFHHYEELLAEIKIVPAKDFPMSVELLHVCLVISDVVERAATMPKERQPDVVRTVFNRYGDFCDIEPALHNATVDVFEVSTQMSLTPTSAAYHEFEACYQDESE